MMKQDKQFPVHSDTSSQIDNSKWAQLCDKFKIVDLIDLSGNYRNALAQNIYSECSEHCNDKGLNIKNIIELVEQDAKNEIRNILAFYVIVEENEDRSSLVGYCSLTKLDVKPMYIAMVGESAWLNSSYAVDFSNTCPNDIQPSFSKVSYLVAVLMEWIENKCNELNIDVAIFTQKSFTSLDVPLHAIAPLIQTGLFRWKADSFAYYKLVNSNSTSDGWFRILVGTREVKNRKLLHQIERVTVDEFLALNANREHAQSMLPTTSSCAT